MPEEKLTVASIRPKTWSSDLNRFLHVPKCTVLRDSTGLKSHQVWVMLLDDLSIILFRS